jgi:hypothetical protein
MDRNKWDTWDKQYGEAQIEKWMNGIDLRTATDSEIQEYTSTKVYEYMDCNRRGYGYDTWIFFWEDFNCFTTKDFDRLGQNYRKELRSQLKETYRPSTDTEFECLLAILEALPIEALPIEAFPIEALPVETNESALPIDTDTNELEIDEPNQLAIPFTNITEPSMEGTFTLETDELSVEDVHISNTLVSPPLPLRSIPGTGFGQSHAFQRTNGSVTPTYTSAGFEFQASQRTGVG